MSAILGVSLSDNLFYFNSPPLLRLGLFFLGLRLLDRNGRTDIEEAVALSYASDIIDVYSNSWGPLDNGSNVSGPKTLTKLVLKMGVSEVSIIIAKYTHTHTHIIYIYISAGLDDQIDLHTTPILMPGRLKECNVSV